MRVVQLSGTYLGFLVPMHFQSEDLSTRTAKKMCKYVLKAREIRETNRSFGARFLTGTFSS